MGGRNINNIPDTPNTPPWCGGGSRPWPMWAQTISMALCLISNLGNSANTLETNKQSINFVSAWERSWFMSQQTNFNTDVEDSSPSVECRQLFLSRWKWTLFHLGFYLLWDNKRCMNKEELFPKDSFPPDKLMGNRKLVWGETVRQFFLGFVLLFSKKKHKVELKHQSSKST